ncbi:hypothetical protein TNCV_1332911 [Trichonephila clavipes]|nr:hypothetical protein TNCV_1332911 [Trichonephila clavipes]
MNFWKVRTFAVDIGQSNLQNSQTPSVDHPRRENIVAERVALTTTGTHKFSYYRYKSIIPVTSCAEPLLTEALMGGRHVMGATIPNDLQQLDVRENFLRCGGLLDDWSVESVMSLVFV